MSDEELELYKARMLKRIKLNQTRLEEDAAPYLAAAKAYPEKASAFLALIGQPDDVVTPALEDLHTFTIEAFQAWRKMLLGFRFSLEDYLKFQPEMIMKWTRLDEEGKNALGNLYGVYVQLERLIDTETLNIAKIKKLRETLSVQSSSTTVEEIIESSIAESRQTLISIRQMLTILADDVETRGLSGN